MAKRFIVLLAVCVMIAAMDRGRPGLAQDSGIPAPVCVLAGGRALCYAESTGAPRFLSQEGVRVIDFALSPDGTWMLYRTEDGGVWVASEDGSQSAQIDAGALPPADLDPAFTTIDWSPDGQSLAYITASGARIALPTPSGAPLFAAFGDRLYTNLRFSPGGGRLAVQDITGSWSLFSLTARDGVRESVQPLTVLDAPGEAAWLDDNSLFFAPDEGGLRRLNVSQAGTLETAWNQHDEIRFTKLVTAREGQVRAFVHDFPGDPLGTPMSIDAGGTLEALGSGKVDPRANWIAGGQLLVYITSGTPILIFPTSGGEDALYIPRVTRLAWGAPSMVIAGSLALDADLYFLAIDEQSQQQVWRLPGDGITPVQQVTRISGAVHAYAVSPDRRSLAIIFGLKGAPSQLAIFPLPGVNLPTPTPFGIRATPLPEGLPGFPGSRVLAVLNSATGGGLAWRGDGRQIAFIDGRRLYAADVPADFVQRPALSLLAEAPEGQFFASLAYSPDRGALLVESRTPGGASGVWQIVPSVMSVNAFQAATAIWGLNALFAADLAPDGQGIFSLSALDSASQARLAASAYPIVAIQPLGGGGLGAAGQSALFLRDVGWPVGPSVVQMLVTRGDPNPPEVRSGPVLLGAPLISPTGRFLAGTGRANFGKQDRLIVVDLQNGRRVVIKDTLNVEALSWVR